MLRSVARVLGGVLLALVALVCLAPVVLYVSLQTAWGREQLRTVASKTVSDALDAHFEIARIDQASFSSVRGSGLSLTHNGTRVASLERFSIGFNLLALLGKRIEVTSAELDQPFVDLGAPLDQGGGGLLGLLQDSTDASSTPASTSGLSIVLRGALIRDGRVEATMSGTHFAAAKLNADTRIGSGAKLRGDLNALAFDVLRDGQPLAIVRAERLGYTNTGAFNGHVRIEMAGASAGIALALGAPGTGGARRIDAKLDMRGVSPETLAKFGIASDWLVSAVDLSLSASGTTHDGKLEAKLSTQGGDVRLEAQLAQAERVTASLYIDKLDTRRVLRDGFQPLAARVDLHAKTARDLSALTAEIELHNATYAGFALPKVTLNGGWSRDRGIVLEQLDARDARAGGMLSASGSLRPDGELTAQASAHVASLANAAWLQALEPGLSGAIELRVKLQRAQRGWLNGAIDLSATKPALKNAGADALRLKLTGQGANLRDARMQGQLTSSKLRFARIELARADLALQADPRRYSVHGNFGKQGTLDLHAEWQGKTLCATGNANIDLGRDQRLQLALGDLRYQRERVVLRNTKLTLGKASARVNGWLEPQGQARLTASIRVPELRDLTQLVLEEPIAGDFALDARVEGALARPHATLKSRYRSPNAFGLQNVVLAIEASLDTPERKLALDVQLDARHTAVELSASSTLAASELSLVTLERSKHDLTLEIAHFPLVEFTLFPSAGLRLAEGDVSGKVHLQGSLREPVAHVELITEARFHGDKTPIKLTLDSNFEHAKIALTLKGSDNQGPLFESHVETELDDGAPFARSVADLSQVLETRPWAVEVSLRARRVEQFPAVHAVAVQATLLPWRISAHAKLEHRPGQEPEGELQTDASFAPARERADGPRCGASGPLRIELRAKMRGGALTSQTQVRIAERNALVLETHSRAPLDEWLKPSSPQPVDLVADFQQLRFSSLPVLCERLDGSVTGRVRLARAITPSVELDAKLKISNITWGDAPAFDAFIDARADRDDMLAKVEINGAAGAATLTAKLPLDATARVPMPRTDAPMQIEARLQEMSVAALLGGIPLLSADGGAIDGVIRADGTLAQPLLHGTLALRQVSVTLGQIGQRFEDVTGSVAFDGRTIRLAKTRVHDRDGQLDLTAELTLQSLDRFQLSATGHAKRYPIRRDGVVLGRFDGDVQLAARVQPEQTQINLALRKAAIELTEDDLGPVQALKPNRDVRFSDVRAGDPIAEEDVGKTVIQIDASEPLWVRREDFSALVSTRMTVVSEGDTPEITGAIEIKRGMLQLIGQLFDIDHGRIEFSGGHAIDPEIDLVAKRTLPGGTIVGVEAQGPLHEPTLTFTVDDKPVTAEEALAALSGAGSTGSASMQSQLSSVATGMAAGVLTLGARRQLGDWVPVLAVESGASETRVRAGIEARRLIPKFLRSVVIDAYVEGMVSSAQDSNQGDSDNPPATQTQAAVLLELAFPHRLVGEAQYGPGQRWSADLSWEP